MEHFDIQNLIFSHAAAKGKLSLDGVSLRIRAGEFLVLCGRSGSGKTTLLRHLKTVLTPNGKRSGEILFCGTPLAQVSERDQAAKIGFVMQNPDDQIVTDKVWHELAFGLESLGCDQTAMRTRVAEMACYFGIQDWFHRDVATLSGGQKQLLNLASIMAMQPEVLILDDEENELILPKAEQIPNDFYRKGDTIKAIVKSVEMNNNQPRIILSRTANQFLERLFEQEVPEIFDGLITIKKIVRIPGERAKVAVESYDERIDPVGACVGMKGSRIYSIVKELRNENIDVVNYTANPTLMIQRSLNPAKVSSITIDEEKMTASVYLKPDQVSLAIGKGGLNIRLSKMLTGYDIDVYREVEEEDVALTEFADEIDGWIIDALKNVGCDTAKSVLELPVEEIAARADLELEQAQKVVEILKAEFEE